MRKKNKANLLIYIDVNNPAPHFVVAQDYFYNEIKVPAGFRTDFTSIPFFLRMFLNSVDDTAIAAVIHDMYYIDQTTTRKEADYLFLQIMKDHQVKRWKRNLYFVGIRLAGWVSWNKKKCLRWLRDNNYLSEKEYKKLRKNGL